MTKEYALFNSQGHSDRAEKLPTLRQYLRTSGKKQLPKCFLVRLVWFPGQWSNYTLQTEHFRLRVPDKHPLFPALREFVGDSDSSEIPIGIEVTDREKCEFTLTRPKEKGAWTFIGDQGMRWQA